MKHELKIWPVYFDAIVSGDKTFEVRSVKDRFFSQGDTLLLKEWEPSGHPAYTGREITVQVTYVLPGITYNGDEAVVMSIFMLKERHGFAKKALGDFRDDIQERWP